MAPDLDRRTYDLLRFVDQHEPIGSIQLVELMQRHGYEIKDRTIRLTLAELDERGLTEKVPGRGRRLTRAGRHELEQGNVSSRLDQIRAHIATLTSQVSYDPTDDAGELIVSAAYLEADALEQTLELLSQLDRLPPSPVVASVTESAKNEPGAYRLVAPSSITLDGVLLTHGIDTQLTTAGVLEYEPVDPAQSDSPVEVEPSALGGHLTRYVDIINGEGSSIDVITLLVEAGRTDVQSVLEGTTGLVVGDDRDVPINRSREATVLATASRNALGGVLRFRKPRNHEPVSRGGSAWAFSSITYVGLGELLIAALNEYGLTDEWETLYGLAPRYDLETVDALTASALLERE